MEIPKLQNQVYQTHEYESRKMTIQSEQGFAKGLSLMRSGIYSDKELAVIREYICNAIDEHTKHNIVAPVEVTINEDGIYFRDFALGLDKESIFTIFGAFFESTKTKGQIGGFGLGSKAGHAYNDVFFVSSFHGGLQTDYAFVLGAENGVEAANSNLLRSTPSDEPTGLLVHVPFESADDLTTFMHKTQQFAKYANFPIKLNGELIEASKPIYSNGNMHLYKDGSGTYIRMGAVMYSCTKYRLQHINNGQVKVVIDVPMNSVTIPPSREVVSYSKETVKFLDDEFKAIDQRIEDYSNSLAFSPVAADLFNIYVYGNLPDGFGHSWLNRSLLTKALRAKYSSLIDPINKIGFIHGKNSLKGFTNWSNRMKNLGNTHLPATTKILIFKTDTGIGDAKHAHLEVETKNSMLRYIKNTEFNMAELPKEIAPLFLDYRTYKFPRLSTTPAQRNPSTNIGARRGGWAVMSQPPTYWETLIKNGDIKFYYDEFEKHDRQAHLKNATDAVFVKTAKAKAFFSTRLPTFIEWCAKNKAKLEKSVVSKRNIDYAQQSLGFTVRRILKLSHDYNATDLKRYDLVKTELKWVVPTLSEDVDKVVKWLDSEDVLAYAMKNENANYAPKWLEQKAKAKIEEILNKTL